MPKGEKSFDAWHKKVYEAAKQVDWDGYNVEVAAVDAIVMQMKSTFHGSYPHRAQPVGELKYGMILPLAQYCIFFDLL